MKKTFRIIALILILCLAFALCSCANKEDEESAEAGTITENSDSDAQQSGDNENNSQNKPSDSDNTQDNQNKPSDEHSDKDGLEQTKPSDNNSSVNTPSDDKQHNSSSQPSDDNTSDGEDEYIGDFEPYKPEPQFDTYVSNTYVPTGNHYALKSGEEVTKIFRGVFPVQQTGRLEYCFYFSNCVDSTWAGGDVAYRDMATDCYEILSAAVMTTKTTDAKSIARRQTVTFDGKKTRMVNADEMFWSDPITYNVAEGEYLVFEWKVKYTFIPCNKINGVGYGYESTDNGNTFVKVSDGMPMPSMIGAKRDGVKSVAFIGDSITAGEGAGVHNGYVAQISKALGKDVSVWNLGLGYARANDAVNSPAWLKKAKTADTVAICFGVNDINSGAYQVGTRTADQVIADITAIAKEMSDAGCKVIIISTPPYTYADAARVQKWKDVVKGLQKLAKDNKYDYFDFGKCVADPSDNTTPAYGGHPNGEGCKIVADTFMKEYKNGTITFK